MKTYKTQLRKLSLREEKTEFKKSKITGPDDCYKVLKPLFAEEMTIYESFTILLLNQANNTHGVVRISQGGISSTVVDVRIICKYAIETLSSGVILAHNHPSGTLKASAQDIAITKKIKQALKMFDINLLDHMILTEDGYLSIMSEHII